MGLIEAVLFLGLAAGPDDAVGASVDAIRVEALADLERRVGSDAVVEKKPQQEDPKPQRPDTPLPPPQPEDSGTPFFDWDWLELHVRVGVAKFSKQFHINTSPAFAIAGRVPITFLAPASNPEGDYFGLWAQLEGASIKRTIEPQVDKPSGVMMSLGVGADYTIIRNSTWLVMVKAGLVYVTYGGVTDLKDGIGPIVGVEAGLALTRSVNIILAPEYIMGGSGDSIIVGTLGVTIDF